VAQDRFASRGVLRWWSVLRSGAASAGGRTVALALATATLWAYLGWLRRLTDYGPWRLQDFWPPGFDPYVLGQAVQEWMLPAVLVGLLAAWPPLGWVLLERSGWRRRGGWLAALVLVQVVYFAYLRTFDRLELDHRTAGEALVVFAGMLLGPLAGTLLGAVSAVGSALLDLLEYPPERFDWADVVRWYLLYSSTSAALVWLGAAAGWLGGLTARRPSLRLWGLGGGTLVVLARFFMLLGEGDPADGAELLLPLGLAAAGLLAGLALLLRSLRLQEAERRAREGELALTQAELAALRTQINPHFLFNALGTIRYFVRTDPEEARRLLLKLSEVFQRVLHSGAFVSLADEIGYAEAYLALEQARMGERLRVEWTRPEGDLLQVQVPALILEPLVENAVTHGLAPKPEGGTVRILIERWGGELVIQVRDDGVGFDPTAPAADADDPPVALTNIDRRLRMLYGAERGLRIESEPGRGTRVELRLPLTEGTA